MNKWKLALYGYIQATNTHNFENVKEYVSNHAIYYFSDKSCISHKEIQLYFENSWNTIKK